MWAKQTCNRFMMITITVGRATGIGGVDPFPKELTSTYPYQFHYYKWFYSDALSNLPLKIDLTGSEFKTTVTRTQLIKPDQNDRMKVRTATKSYTEKIKGNMYKEVLVNFRSSNRLMIKQKMKRNISKKQELSILLLEFIFRRWRWRRNCLVSLFIPQSLCGLDLEHIPNWITMNILLEVLKPNQTSPNDSELHPKS